MTQLMSLNPDPLKGGQPAKLCYSGTLPATITVSGLPAEANWPTTLSIGMDGCVTFDVPANGTSVVFIDDSGASINLSSVVA